MKKYPSMNVTSMDISFEMLQVHKMKNNNANCIVGNAENPPFRLASFDTILSSLTLHWCTIDSNLFLNFSNLLKPNGLLLFSVSGPDTFKEFKKMPNTYFRKTQILRVFRYASLWRLFT